jgi:putative membrane protein
MRSSLIVALLIAMAALVFALQNAIPITVALLGWKFESSLALLLLVTLVLGVLLGFSFSMPAIFRRSREISRQKVKIKELEKSLEIQQNSAKPPQMGKPS